MTSTRHRQGHESSLLDLILSNEENMVENMNKLPPLGKSDHVVICFKYVCYSVERKPKARAQYFGGD